MSAYGMTLTVLCIGLAEAVAKDEAPAEGGFDLSAGMFGSHVSAWLRSVAAQLPPPPRAFDVYDHGGVEGWAQRVTGLPLIDCARFVEYLTPEQYQFVKTLVEATYRCGKAHGTLGAQSAPQPTDVRADQPLSES